MLSLVVSAGLVVSALSLVWFSVRDYVVRSPLDNIPGPSSSSVFSGNFLQLFARDSWCDIQDLCEKYGPVSKIYGFFGSRWIHVYDPKALHSIFLRDQDSYFREEQAVSSINLQIGPSLLGTYGDVHKRQRKILNPAFSVAHMRDMTPLFYNICDKLYQAIKARVEDGPNELDMLGWMGRTALEIVGQGGLGYSFDPLVADSKDEFTQAVKEFFPSLADISFVRPFVPYVKYLGPAWFRRILLDLLPSKRIQRVKRTIDFMQKRSEEIIIARKTAIENGKQELLQTVGEGKDLMSTLLRENMVPHGGDKLTEEELLAQVSTFIFAGVDTTSNALSRVLHQLAMHPEVQNKLRTELLDAREQYGQDIPYDELSQLPFLDSVCRETLRLFAPITFVQRQALRDTVLPLGEPIQGIDGTAIPEIFVPKGTMMLLNIRACNMYKALWGEDSYEWKPERWLEPLPREVEEAHIPGIYANTMTFINGSNSCIGFKFSQLEMKVVLAVLISSFKFSISKKPIVWQFAGIAYPASAKGSTKPEMYLTVGLV